MPMRYGENVLAARGGMARAAEIQGRNEKDAQSTTKKEGDINAGNSTDL